MDPGEALVSSPRSLALPATRAQVAQFVAQRAAACVGADYSNLALLDAGSHSLHLFHNSSLDSDVARRYIEFPLDAPYPIAAAVQSGQAVLLPDLESYKKEFPEILADTIAAGVQATASLPLYRPDGTLLGAIGFAWACPTPFDRRLEGALHAVANLCVETIERAAQYDTQHELIVELQHRLLGDLPVLPGVRTSARYIPATSDLSIGGDWYEGLSLRDSTIAFVVGDVVGHGLEAAADMAVIRGMVSALLHSGIPPSDVFRDVSGVVIQRTALLLATAALAIVDVADATVTYATAGHPPPLLRLPDGRVLHLDNANCPLIGIPAPSGLARTVPFVQGSQLVMYTDGLIERRDRPFDLGVAMMAEHLSTLPTCLSAEDLVESLLNTLLADAPDDDVALLVVEHTA
jgi:hypothetical protein